MYEQANLTVIEVCQRSDSQRTGRRPPKDTAKTNPEADTQEPGCRIENGVQAIIDGREPAAEHPSLGGIYLTPQSRSEVVLVRQHAGHPRL